jgi:hypothetical protein
MGLINAIGIATSDLPLDKKISLHLSTNFYEPINEVLYPACLKAVEETIAGNPEALIELPSGYSVAGSNKAPASILLENYHLEIFTEGGGGVNSG